jgi:ABC-type cobalamin/Fe3+-siderophores transport system ATPase subunit
VGVTQLTANRQPRPSASPGRAAVVLSTDEPDHAFLCADRVALLHGGRLVALGTPEEMLTPENLRLLFGVDVAVVFLPEVGRRVCSRSSASFPQA